MVQSLVSAAQITPENKDGCMLGRPAGKITMLDIVTAVQGPIALATCLSPSRECRLPTIEASLPSGMPTAAISPGLWPGAGRWPILPLLRPANGHRREWH